MSVDSCGHQRARKLSVFAAALAIVLVASACVDDQPVETVAISDGGVPAAAGGSEYPASETASEVAAGDTAAADAPAAPGLPVTSEEAADRAAADSAAVDSAAADSGGEHGAHMPETGGDQAPSSGVSDERMSIEDQADVRATLGDSSLRRPGQSDVERRRPGRRRPPGTPPGRPTPPTDPGNPAPTPTPAPPTDPGHPAPHPTPTPNPAPPPDSGAPADRVITGADQGSLGNGFTVPAGQIWEFDPNRSVSIDVSRNVVVNGVLRMRPANGSVTHRIRFVNVDETKYVGGGMSILDSDVGLWVFGSGQLDLQGQRREGWTNLGTGANRGATSITLASAPTGWSVGDEIAIAPTSTGRDNHLQFDERTITSISGSTLGLSSPLSYDHPTVDGTWNAEVMNLTRNVQIEGTGSNTENPSANGRAHIMVHSSAPQSIKYVQLRHLGPRVNDNRGRTNGVEGRYSLHFHHSGDGARGSIVEGVVVRNSGNSAYVPHASNGITIRDSIAYDGWENAVWWDPPGERNGAGKLRDFTNDSSDITIDKVIVAGLQGSGGKSYLMSAFTLATGTNMTLRNSVAIGVQGRINTSGFHWPEHTNTNNVWTFENNVAHNNTQFGIFAWQNGNREHVIRKFGAYHNGKAGVLQGAYVSAFQYFDTKLYGNGGFGLEQHAGAHNDRIVQRPDGYTGAWDGLETNGPLTVLKQAVPSGRSVLFRNCSFTYVDIRNVGDGKGGNPGRLDFVDCGLEASDFRFTSPFPGTEIRVQNGSSAYSISTSGAVTTIAPFYN